MIENPYKRNEKRGRPSMNPILNEEIKKEDVSTENVLQSNRVSQIPIKKGTNNIEEF